MIFSYHLSDSGREAEPRIRIRTGRNILLASVPRAAPRNSAAFTIFRVSLREVCCRAECDKSACVRGGLSLGFLLSFLLFLEEPG